MAWFSYKSEDARYLPIGEVPCGGPRAEEGAEQG